MKNRIIHLLQSILGFERYLFIFSVFIIYKLKWDKKERDFLKLFDLIKSDDGLVLDIGANLGAMTTHFAKKLPKSEVFSFEPIPQNIRTLERIIKHFNLSNVKVFKLALNDSEDKLKMIMPIQNSARKQGLSHVKEDLNSKEEDGEEFDVLAKGLDDVIEVNTSKKEITAIKIDVEGHEYKVIKGAVNTIQKHKPIIYCELWPGAQRNITVDFLESLGYESKILVNKKLVSPGVANNQNFFFIPE